ncbi:MAG: hypothetical protein R3330_01330 [Saprospiraceae bacterium]|nr:hypothetical protein [Saprospiraceae bacterium]
MKWSLILCLVFSIASAMLQAQSGTPDLPAEPSADEHIASLAKGTLLVRLPGNRAKVRAIEQALEQDDLSDRSRERLEALLTETLEETEATHQAYTSAFKEEYQFSEVGFFYDYDTPAVLEGWGKVMSDDLTTDLDMQWDQPWYILSIGRTPDSRVNGLVVLDHKLDPLPRPFPRTVITSGLAAIGAWFSGGAAEHYFVRKLQKNLQRFADR